MKLLVTGGTVFVSRYIAEYFVARGMEVYVLNRNTRPQSEGVHLIQADRRRLGEALRHMHFDAVIDTAYNAEDVNTLLEALGGCGDYVLISSSAVYPENENQPFREDSRLGLNRYWGRYGTDKIAAEETLLRRKPEAYVIRPPYLYGPMNNVYREAFVFECALKDRPFYLPGEGEMQLQFFHIDDLCRLIQTLLDRHPEEHIFNAGNGETVSVRTWAELCYEAAGKKPRFVSVSKDVEQRSYFSFYDYEYRLDITRQNTLLEDVKPLRQGLQEAFDWYVRNADQVNRKDYLAYIDTHLAR